MTIRNEDHMAKEKYGKTKHKSPKFKEYRDEELCWEDQVEMLKGRKKKNKKHQSRTTIRGIW